VAGTTVFIPQIISPIPSPRQLISVSQMYTISPPVSDWNINYNIGIPIVETRTYSIKNITTNTALSIFISTPSMFSLNRNTTFTIFPSSTEMFSVQFNSVQTLIASLVTSMKISVTPIVTDTVQLMSA
jgi:hypothetical protein